MMCATLSLPFIMTRGPLTQDFIGKQIQVCQTDGWWNLFFLQNFFETKVNEQLILDLYLIIFFTIIIHSVCRIHGFFVSNFN